MVSETYKVSANVIEFPKKEDFILIDIAYS